MLVAAERLGLGGRQLVARHSRRVGVMLASFPSLAGFVRLVNQVFHFLAQQPRTTLVNHPVVINVNG